MITLEDCVALCGLTQDEVHALAEHEHIPDIAAAALGQCLLHQPKGCQIISDMIADGMRRARQRGDEKHANELALILQQFVTSHPEISDLPHRS
jgi:hypothetical protein